MECGVLSRAMGYFFITLLLHQSKIDGYKNESISTFGPQSNLTFTGKITSSLNSPIFTGGNSSTLKTEYYSERHIGKKSIDNRKKKRVKPPLLQRRQTGQTRRKSCFKQTCKQTISGRNLRYQRALNVIQSEDYLTEADKDSILKLKRVKRSPDSENKTHDEVPRNTEIYQLYKKSLDRRDLLKIFFKSGLQNNQSISRPKFHRSRTRRQVSQFAYVASSYCGQTIQDASTFIFYDATNFCYDICSDGCITSISSFDLITACNFDLLCLIYFGYDILVTDYNSCVDTTVSILSSLLNYFCPPQPDGYVGGLITGNLPQTATTVGVVGAAAFIQTPPLPMVTPSGTPPGVPTPGLSVASLASGGLNPAAIGGSLAAAALLLVPLGLVPIAVFPPYQTERTLPAISVIFAEDPNIMQLNDDVTLMRTRRAVVQEMRKSMQKNYRRPSLFSSLWNSLLDKFRLGRKKIKFIKDEIICLRTKIEYIKMKIKQKIRENREGKKKTTTTTTTETPIYHITTRGPTKKPLSQTIENFAPFESNEDMEPSTNNFFTVGNDSDSSTEQLEEVSWVPNFDSKEIFDDDGSAPGEFRPPPSMSQFKNNEAIKSYVSSSADLDVSTSNLLKRRLRRQVVKEMNSMDDCFEGMPEPKYGFRTRVTLVDEKPCDFPTTCKVSEEDDPFENIRPRSDGDFIDRQTGEDFSAEGPSTCRIKLDFSNSNC